MNSSSFAADLHGGTNFTGHQQAEDQLELEIHLEMLAKHELETHGRQGFRLTATFYTLEMGLNSTVCLDFIANILLNQLDSALFISAILSSHPTDVTQTAVSLQPQTGIYSNEAENNLELAFLHDYT